MGSFGGAVVRWAGRPGSFGLVRELVSGLLLEPRLGDGVGPG